MPQWSNGEFHPNSFEPKEYRAAVRILIAKLDSQLAEELRKRDQLLSDLAAAPPKAKQAAA
jgi:hypothetical protein